MVVIETRSSSNSVRACNYSKRRSQSNRGDFLICGEYESFIALLNRSTVTECHFEEKKADTCDVIGRRSGVGCGIGLSPPVSRLLFMSHLM